LKGCVDGEWSGTGCRYWWTTQGAEEEGFESKKAQARQASGETERTCDRSTREKSRQGASSNICPKDINEPNPPCVICGKPIDSISQSIGGPQPETFSHFDCVLRKIADDEHILPTQKVSYIGRGTFAIIEVQSDGKFTILKRIPYENPETYSFMKKYVENQKN